MRISRWFLLFLIVVGGFGAALGFIVYVANGLVAGDLIGLTGRANDITVAQHRSGIGLLAGVLLQCSAAGALFGCMKQEGGSNVGRILSAAFASCAVTTLCGLAILLSMKALR